MVSMTAQRFLALFIGVAILASLAPGAFGRPSEPGDISAVADALKYLQELDRYYAQVARPRYARSGSAEPPELAKVERAIKLLQLQHLDRFYSKHSRPRFGKRAEMRAPIQESMDEWNGPVFSRR